MIQCVSIKRRYWFYHLCGRVKNSHMLQDSGTVVGDDYFTIAGLNLGTV